MGPPRMAVVDKKKKREIGRFDESGEMEASGADMIARMKAHFMVKPENGNAAGENKTKKRKVREKEQHDGTTGI